jgi:hypothetical protein
VKIYPTSEKVAIKWFGVSQDVRVPANATMRGTWGWDAVCSCGWDSCTGGAIRSSVESDVQMHKIMEHNYSRLPQNLVCTRCKEGVHSLATFPDGTCVKCYALTEEANRPITARQLSQMWGGK